MSDKNKKVNKLSNAIILDPAYLKDAKKWEEFISLWLITKEIELKNQWFKGDIADKVAVTYGDGSLSKFADEIKESVRTIENYRRVARAFPENKRNLDLSWTHYFIASYTDSFKKSKSDFDTKERFDWINKAHDNGWTTTRLADEINKQGALKDKDDSAVFNYYETYLRKIRGILMSVEKSKLSDIEKDKLINKLLDIYNEFMVYLKEKK